MWQSRNQKMHDGKKLEFSVCLFVVFQMFHFLLGFLSFLLKELKFWWVKNPIHWTFWFFLSDKCYRGICVLRFVYSITTSLTDSYSKVFFHCHINFQNHAHSHKHIFHFFPTPTISHGLLTFLASYCAQFWGSFYTSHSVYSGWSFSALLKELTLALGFYEVSCRRWYMLVSDYIWTSTSQCCKFSLLELSRW